MALYLFVAGGSAVRTLCSFTMLLAAGYPLQTDCVVPVIIDNDTQNHSIKRCSELISLYNQIRAKQKTTGNYPHCFATEIKHPLFVAGDGRSLGDLDSIIDLNDASNETLKEEAKLLFSLENRKMPLEYGFIGNPNIGTIALNKFFYKNSEFDTIISGITNQDRIFIISSIFGGTGASGFPLLVNHLRGSSVVNRGVLNEITIGALSLLPYFKISDVEGGIATGNISNIYKAEERGIGSRYNVNSDAFLPKTLAAMEYYNRYMKNMIEAIYYVGDNKTASQYDKALGGRDQKNGANFVELVGALSVFHFVGTPFESKKTIYHEFAFHNENSSEIIRDCNLSHIQIKPFQNALIRLQLMELFWCKYIPTMMERPNAWSMRIGYGRDLMTNPRQIGPLLQTFFTRYFDEWRKELRTHSGGRTFTFFAPETIDIGPERILEAGFKFGDNFGPKGKAKLFGMMQSFAIRPLDLMVAESREMDMPENPKEEEKDKILLELIYRTLNTIIRDHFGE